jgi:hypothetical protein
MPSITLSVLLLLGAVILVWKDRHDWKKYVYVALAFTYFGATPAGNQVREWLNGAFAAVVDFASQMIN